MNVEVTVDGNLIAFRRPGDLPAFCRTTIFALEGEVSPPVYPICQQIMYRGKTWD